MNPDKLKQLEIEPDRKRRPRGAIYMAWPKPGDKDRIVDTGVKTLQGATPSPGSTNEPALSSSPAAKDSVLTVSGYIVNRERIELSPRFLGVVTWIGVKKGDSVTNGQVVVLLDDTEYNARLVEAEGKLASAKAMVTRATLDYERVNQLARTDIESKKAQDDARLEMESAKALVMEAEGTREVASIYLGWTVIRSPINGVVLEKLVDPNELVVPQSFGGPRGPSTALIAVADPSDLQVEIDLNEADLSKISLNQKCRVSPEAYPDKIFDGVVAEIAPEANRAKGTLQIKVQIKNPDRFLTPELSAKVEFLKP